MTPFMIASPAAALMEPMVAGLKIYLGDEVIVAREIEEVGKDVAERIRERQEQKESVEKKQDG